MRIMGRQFQTAFLNSLSVYDQSDICQTQLNDVFLGENFNRLNEADHLIPRGAGWDQTVAVHAGRRHDQRGFR